MLIKIGHVEAIFRYPVKSMRSEQLEAAKLGWHGIDGDRRLAFRRIDNRSGMPWLTASKLPELLLFAPLRREDGAQEDLPTHIRTPDGEEMTVFGEDLATEVGRRHRAPVEMMQLNHGIFDEAPISVIASDTVREIGRLAGRSLDVATISPECCSSFTAICSLPGGRVAGRCALIRRGGRRAPPSPSRCTTFAARW